MVLDKPLAVIKVGGDILLEESQRQGLAANITALKAAGWDAIILHGGGPQVSTLQHNLGMKPKKIEGRRMTDEASLTVVKQAIVGEVNVNLVSSLIAGGVNAFGCHGASAKLIRASKRPPMLLADQQTRVDFGEVGDVVDINTTLLQHLLSADIVPVIATLGVDDTGRVFNINADTTVVKIAEGMKAELLLLTTAIGGIFHDINDKASRIATIDKETVGSLIQQGVIHSGMIPKVTEAFRTLEQGTKRVVILSAIEKSAFLSAANGENLFGTTLCL